MKKKVLSMLLVAAMTASMVVGCGGGDSDSNSDKNSTQGSDDKQQGSNASGDKTITLWVADNVVDFTKSKAEEFFATDSKYDGYTVNVEAVSESESATNMITDVEGGADIFSFAQDQMTRLVAAGALTPQDGNADWIKEQNDEGSIGAATVGDKLYAYPMTSDNGYFLYYDSSVVTNPDSLEQIIADCEAAGKNFYYEYGGGWYQSAVFFATGCMVTYDTDAEGNFTGCNINYASDEGLVALKKLVEIASSPIAQNKSSANEAVDYAVLISGTWDADTVKSVLGDNYACAKLPKFTGSDGKEYQMSGFGGFKLLGVKPQTDPDKLAVCNDLAQYLTSSEVQLARYELVGWGPSNLTAQQDEAVQADETLAALADQLQYTIPQGQYPQAYWDAATSLGGDLEAGQFSGASDDDLRAVLETYQSQCEAAAQ